MYRPPPQVKPARSWWQELLARLGLSLFVFGVVLVLLAELPWPLAVLALVGGVLLLRRIGALRFARSRHGGQATTEVGNESTER